MAFYKTEQVCRASNSRSLQPVIAYGQTPLADRLLTQVQLTAIEHRMEPELLAPLTLVFCSDSALVQIQETVDPEVLFYKDYPYFSSVSKSLLQHFRKSALELIETQRLNARSLVVEADSSIGHRPR
jgi:hypothetical protein